MAVSSCISDGANRTGGAYLAEQGILLQDPLYHVILKNLPVDSFWTTDAEPSHIGDSTMLVGSQGDFTAEGRLAFHINDTAILYRMSAEDSTSFKLSLGFPPYTAGLSAMKASVRSDTTALIDSVPIEVKTWEITDQGLSDDQWADTLQAWNRRYLFRDDTLAVMDTSRMVRDTIYLGYQDAYTHNTPQAKPLRNLHRRLVEARGARHFLEMRLTRISLIPQDAPAGMLRLGGYTGSTEAEFVYSPILLFGSFDSTVNTPSENRLATYLISRLTSSNNYTLKYAGPRTDMVTGKTRGLHVILDREALLDSIDAALERQGKTPQPRPTAADFDLAYFVPFAKMSLPLDTTKSIWEGGFPLVFNSVSSVDTLLGDTITGGIRLDTVLLNTSKVLWHTYEIGHLENVQDEVSLAYSAFKSESDSAMRRVILRFSRDSSINDTVYLRPGETRQRLTSLAGFGPNSLTLDLTASGDTVFVRNYLTRSKLAENNEFRDPETGERIDDLLKRLPRFLQPGQDNLTLRVTNGIQRLLNRVQSNANILQDFQFQPNGLAAVDPKNASGESGVPLVVRFPVLSVVAPAIENGKLKVDVDLYLYPLKAR
ncbi:MAG: hypothetical protein ABI036_01975 [Fibrobacteria bacterium]